MPSGITHIFLIKTLQDKIHEEKLKNILGSCVDFLIVGAVAPDLPYASFIDFDIFFTSEIKLADDFHFDKTNQIPLQSLKILKDLGEKTDMTDSVSRKIHHQMFSFFIGHMSHVVADGIMHPFIRDMVGDYNLNKSAHRSLEMQLDILYVADFYKPYEVNYMEIHKQLSNYCSFSTSRHTSELFLQLIESIYGKKVSRRKFEGWIIGLTRLFALAAGKHPKMYRRLKKNTFTFKNKDDILPEKALILEKPKDRDLNFIKKDRIHFLDDCIPKFYEKYIPIFHKAYCFVYENGPMLTEMDIPAINLDTGRLKENDDLNLIPEFWKET